MIEKSPRIYKILLMILPIGVVVGTVVFMFMYFYMERKENREHAVIASYGIRINDLEDMVEKFTARIGSRNHTTPEGRKGLKRASAMISGRLGPQNVGYPINKGEGTATDGVLLKSLWVDLWGEQSPDEVIIAAVSYAGPGKVADANCVSTLMMLASSMAREKPAKTIRFVFLPMNLPPAQQNQWIMERCLTQEETCIGILGLQTMDALPTPGDQEFQVVAPHEHDQQWWQYLQSNKGTAPTTQPVGSVWISAPVYSPLAWKNRKSDQLDQTLKTAKTIETWLQRASK